VGNTGKGVAVGAGAAVGIEVETTIGGGSGGVGVSARQAMRPISIMEIKVSRKTKRKRFNPLKAIMAG
jgi:hypothetical protein